MVWNLRTHGGRLLKENRIFQNNQTSGLLGTDNKGKGKPRTGKGKGKQDTDKGKGEPGMGNGKNKKQRKGETPRQERAEHVSRTGQGMTTRKKHKPVNITQNARTRVGSTLTTGMT